MYRRSAVISFLGAKAPPDIAIKCTEEMEIQVNVAQDDGERVSGTYQGRKWTAWTDGQQTWKSFRIPFNANSTPNYTDTEIKFNLDEHCEGIGLTGWNWVQKTSQWVAYDFDAIVGHSEKHQSKLSDIEISKVEDAASEIPWVTVRKSTSGNGLHLYVYVDNVPTANHTEHAALARAILSKMSAITGFDFDSKIDACGSNMWVWHRKYEASDGEGLKLIKQGDVLKDIPLNWRDHINVAKGRSKRNTPGFIEEKKLDPFEQLCGQHARIELDDQHKALFEYLDKYGCMWWFDADHHMIVCHTYDLAKAHKDLGMRGIFKTLASGKEQGIDQNGYGFPLRNGAWVIRRHTPGVAEANTWDQDSSGWTRCYLNRDPDISIAARTYGALENAKGAWVFNKAEMAMRACAALGVNIDIPPWAVHRQATIIQKRDGKLVVEILRESGDISTDMRKSGWLEDKKHWQNVSRSSTPSFEDDVEDFDDLIRHLVAGSGGDAGWSLQTNGVWQLEPMSHVKVALKALGNTGPQVDLILGQQVLKRWTLVNKPFTLEYPGNREWNRDSAQLRITPTVDLDSLNWVTWLKLLNHCGQSLNDPVKRNKWCADNGINTGGDYLKLWVESTLQFPFEPLPY